MRIVSFGYIFVTPILGLFVRNRLELFAVIVGIVGVIFSNIGRLVFSMDY
jgi:hypothetical protein